MTFRSACAVFAVAAALWPNMAAAQPASSFAELGARVNSGDTCDRDRRPPGLGNQGRYSIYLWRHAGPGRERFPDVLRRIRGTRFAVRATAGERCAWGWNRFVDYLHRHYGWLTEQHSDSVYTWAYVGSWLLPAVGASVGAATGGSKTLFLPARRAARGTSISPWLAPNGAGLAVAIRY